MEKKSHFLVEIWQFFLKKKRIFFDIIFDFHINFPHFGEILHQKKYMALFLWILWYWKSGNFSRKINSWIYTEKTQNFQEKIQLFCEKIVKNCPKRKRSLRLGIGTWSSGIVRGVKMAGNSPQLVQIFGTSNWDLEFGYYCPGCQNGGQLSPVGWRFRDLELGPGGLLLSGVSKWQADLPNWLEFSGHRIGTCSSGIVRGVQRAGRSPQLVGIFGT